MLLRTKEEIRKDGLKKQKKTKRGSMCRRNVSHFSQRWLQRASGKAVHNGHPGGVQDHLLRILQGMPVMLIIVIITLRMIIMIISS